MQNALKFPVFSFDKLSKFSNLYLKVLYYFTLDVSYEVEENASNIRIFNFGLL